ncbi:DUF4956 domain-containing protein [Senegalia massiliensis]|nr:DUF4956 domain-containing protein [Senegalia massiliensis]
MKETIYNLLYEGTSSSSPMFSIQNMIVALILGILVCITYRITYSGVAYNKRFNTSLMMLTLITTMVMNILASSLALSLGMVGALSIIRFRTAVKDPRDTTYIFWAIAIGLGAGSSNYYVVAIGSIFVVIISLILSFGFKDSNSYLIIVRGNLESLETVRSSLFQIYKACKLRAETVTENHIEIVYQIKIRKNENIKEYEKLKSIEGVEFVNMVAQDGETLG